MKRRRSVARVGWVAWAGLLAGSALVVLALAVWVPSLARTAEAGPDAPAERAAEQAGAAEEARGSAPARTADEPAPGRLHVAVVDAEGRPAEGTLRLRFSRTVPSFPGISISQQGLSHDGALSLDVPPGRWTCLAASSAGGGEAFALVPPFVGEHRETLRIDSGAARVHALLVESDLHTPIAGERLGLFVLRPETGFLERVACETPTDGAGYVVLADLEPGTYTLTASGVDPGAGPPACVSLAVWAGSLGRDQVVTLVMPEPRCEVVLRVEGLFKPEPRQPVVLYLKRKDDGSGRHWPITEPIVPGRKELVLELPPGLYEAETLPVGTVVVPAERRRLRVEAGGGNRFVLPVEQNPRRVEVSLTGVREHDLPVAVYPRPAGVLLDDTPRVMFTGPMAWRSLTQEIGCPDFRCRLVAMRSNGFWISERELELAPGARAVEMARGSMLTVRWLDATDRDDVVADVHTRLGDEQRTLRREIVYVDGAPRPAMTGSLVVPFGAVTVTCFDESGEVAWRESVEVEHPLTQVER